MKKISLIFFLFFFSLSSYAQEEFISFLKKATLPSCFDGLNEDQIDQLVTQREIQANWTAFRMKYDSRHHVMYLYSTNHCDDIEKIHLKYIKHLGKEYVFMYKQRIASSESYGRLRVFELNEEEEWIQGRKVEISWQQLFQVSERELERLRQADQFPKYMIRFEERNIMIDIPWKLYTFEQGSETDGFAKARGKQPVKLPYSYFLSAN